ncbi:MAG: hypothetical protein RL143_83 [Pseudomonadota bacterium]|jgi:quinol monooxygenase YgiN
MAEKFVIFVALKPESLLDLHELAKRMRIEALKNSACHHYEYHIHDNVRVIRFDQQWESGYSISAEHQNLIDQMIAASAVYDKIDQPKP